MPPERFILRQEYDISLRDVPGRISFFHFKQAFRHIEQDAGFLINIG